MGMAHFHKYRQGMGRYGVSLETTPRVDWRQKGRPFQTTFMDKASERGAGPRFHFNTNIAYLALHGVRLVRRPLINFHACHGMACIGIGKKKNYGRTVAQNVDDIVDEAGTWWKNREKRKEILQPSEMAVRI